jgi:hypothetical protein
MKTHHLREFLQDARGIFNAFTLTALQAGFTLVTAPLVVRLAGWHPLTHDETGALVMLYCLAALGDAALGIFLHKLPSTLIQDTGGGDASLAAGAEASITLSGTPAGPAPCAE